MRIKVGIISPSGNDLNMLTRSATAQLNERGATGPVEYVGYDQPVMVNRDDPQGDRWDLAELGIYRHMWEADDAEY